MIGSYIVGFANAIMAALIAFNIVLTQTQMGAVAGLVNAGILLVTSILHWYSSRGSTKIVPPVAESRSTVE